MSEHTVEKMSFEGESALFRYGGEIPNKNAALFLHGFPADSGKNEDIAKQLADSLEIDSFVLHYRGLGCSKGLFSFTSSIKDSVTFTKKLKSSGLYKKLFLVGHSWGGLVALNVMRELQDSIEKCILLAPFCVLPDEPDAENLLIDFIEHKKLSGINYDLNELSRDHLEVKQSHAPLKFAASLDGSKISIIQGNNDFVSLPENTIALVNQLRVAPYFARVEDDHWFRGRENLLNFVSTEMKKSGL